ncbi:hypothetical protein, partial [Pelomicrobium sp. G1]|uniref:hypothetical protein n=1 Tax=Pelomicrobium sp. G1 TaxID=3452920 RepID=UPI003F76CAA3
FKLGGICLLLPFFMVAFPNSLQFPNFTGETLVATGLLCISTLMFSAAVYGGFMGRLKTGERIYLLSGPIAALLYYEWRNLWIGMAPLVLLIGFWIYRRSKRRMMAKAVAALEIER